MSDASSRGSRLIGRRSFLQWSAAGLAASALPRAWGELDQAKVNAVKLPPLHSAKIEAKESSPDPGLPPGERVGFAVVGLGHLALGQVLPAFAHSKYARPVALVSGHRDKALKVAGQYGIEEKAIYNYAEFDRLADNPEVKVVYVILPNGMHAEYTLRAARAGKHVLCEKPMAVSVAEAESMVRACAAARVKLMIGYRSQYEPMDRAIVKMVRQGNLGRPLHFSSSNSQDQGDPSQWRLNLAMAGGGPMVDVGIYCLNAARFLTGEEPTDVLAQVQQIPGDPRFREVESSIQFLLRFPSGFAASCNAAYDCHRSQFFRLEGSDGWAQMNPAFAYQGLRLQHGRVVDGNDVVTDIEIEAKDQFALELDHMSECVLTDTRPYTGGEEGLQDMRIIAAAYESAKSSSAVRLAPPGPTRGPEPATVA
jgi:predicted dehydrogenase